MNYIDKYKPKTIDDFFVEKKIKEKLLYLLENKIIENLILVGPPGTGKTLFTEFIIDNIYKDYKTNVKIFNSSDEKTSIDSIQERIYQFCKLKNFNKNCDFKLIIIDEGKNIIKTLQLQLKKIMEININTKFIFIFNSLSDIFETLQSFVEIIKFKKIKVKYITKKLLNIAKLEKIKVNLNDINYISMSSDGDLRKAINLLQYIYLGMGYINEEIINLYNGYPKLKILKEIIDDVIKLNIYNSIININSLLENGFCPFDIIYGLYEYIKNNLKDYEDIKIILLNNLCKSFISITKYNNKLQLIGFITGLYKDLKKLKLK